MFNFDEISSRITVAEILRLLNYEPGEKSMACPIHHGSSPTAFSFTDSVWYCFSCGAQGGLIDLLCILTGKSREEALRWLGEQTSVAIERSGRVRGVVADTLSTLPPYSVAFRIARKINYQADYDLVDLMLWNKTILSRLCAANDLYYDPAIEYDIGTYEEKKLRIFKEAKEQGVRPSEPWWCSLSVDQAMAILIGKICLIFKIDLIEEWRRKCRSMIYL